MQQAVQAGTPDHCTDNVNVTGTKDRCCATLVRCRPLLFAAVLCTAATTPALAQNGGEAGVEEIRVTGRNLERELTAQLAEFGNELELITSEEIANSGQNDVMQILEKMVPGLFVSPRHGNRMGESDPSLQGGDDGTLLWLVDGVRVSMRIFGSFRTFIPPRYIDRIEVLKDGQGLFYGTQAIDGVINIITKDGADLDRGEFSVSGGTVGDGETSLHGLFTHDTQNMDLLLFGSRDEGEAQIFRDRDFDATAVNRLRSWEVNSVGLKLGRNFSPGHFLRLNWLRNDMEIDRPSPENYFKATNDRVQDIVSLKYENHFSERSAFFVKGYWHSWDTDWTRIDINDDGSREVVNEDTSWWFEDYGFNAMATHERDNGSQWAAGVDMQKVEGADYVTSIAPRTETVWAGFLQYRPVLDFTPDTRFAIGARHNIADEGDDSTIWSASARHPITDGLHFRISGGTSFRNPNITELFQDQPDSTFCPLPGVSSPCNQFGSAVAGEELEPQKSTGVNLGFGGDTALFRAAQFGWELGYFDRTIDNLIQPEDLDGSGQTIVVRNADGESTREGLEAQGTLAIGSRWTVHVNGTWVDAENDDSDEQPDLVPESFYKGYVSFDSGDGRWGARLTGVYTGEIHDSINPAVGGRQNFGEYVQFDLSGYYHFDSEGNSRLGLRVENLLDADEAYRLDDATDPVTGAFRRVEHIVPERNLQLTYSQKF